jgi:hypothetical protein
MKTRLIWSLLALPCVVFAQNPGRMAVDPTQMQQMMQQMQGMQDCMANIDQTEMQAFQQKAEEMDAEVKALCADGKRDAAMARAMAFGKDTVHSNLMQQMKACGEGMQQMMPKLPKSIHSEDADNKPTHICDE